MEAYLVTMLCEYDRNEILNQLSISRVHFFDPQSEIQFWKLCTLVSKPSYLSIDIMDLVAIVRDSIARALCFEIEDNVHRMVRLTEVALSMVPIKHSKRLFFWFIVPQEMKESPMLLDEIQELDRLLVSLEKTKEIIWGFNIGETEGNSLLVVLFPTS